MKNSIVMNILKFIVVIYIFTCLIFSCSSYKKNESGWKIAYKNDKDGNALEGSKQELISSIRQGVPIRIAWGNKGSTHSIEHISEPIWIEILDEKEVIAHLDPQVLSVINWDNLSAKYTDSSKLNEEWRVVISTRGEFDAVWYDKKENKQLKRRPQNHVTSWFVKNSVKSITKVKAFFKK